MGIEELNVVSIEGIDNYKVRVKFNTNEIKIYSVKEKFKDDYFRKFSNYGYFKKIRVHSDRVMWDNGEHITIKELYENSTEIEEGHKKELLSKLDKVVEKFKEEINFLAIFGSLAKDEYTDKSDIDIFYDLEYKNIDICDFDDYLHELFPNKKIDLVPIMNILGERNDTVFKYFTEGMVIVYESKRFSDTIKHERLLNRFRELRRIVWL